MSRVLFDKKRIYDSIKNKLNVAFRKGTKELIGWYYLDYRKTIRFKVPKGRGEITPGYQKAIERSSRLCNEDFERLIDCPMKGSEYDNLMRSLRDRNLL